MAGRDHINRVAFDWFYDVDISAAVWGPLHHAMMNSNYNRLWRKSTSGMMTHTAVVIST